MMNISEKLSQEKLLEILTNACLKGEQSQQMNAAELVHDLREQILSYSKR